jgi:ankyrin repeat protein
MIRTIILLFVFINVVNATDIFKLTQSLDRNDTAAFKSMVHTVDDANTARSDNQKSILMYAVWVGNLEAVKHLLAQGANVNASDAGGATALHLAIWKEHTDIALHLLENGASANAISQDGMTPSDIAILRSNTKVMEAIEKKKPKLKPLL